MIQPIVNVPKHFKISVISQFLGVMSHKSQLGHGPG